MKKYVVGFMLTIVMLLNAQMTVIVNGDFVYLRTEFNDTQFESDF